MNVTITQFAFNLASFQRKTLEASLPFHRAYVKADAAGQKQLRREWMLGHVAGSLAVPMDKAERILSAGKGDGVTPKHIKAIDKASSDFRYHVVRPADSAKQSKPVRISAVERGAFAEFVRACGGDMKRALVVANAMAKR